MVRSHQRRVVLSSKYSEIANRILEQTGIKNCSQLFSILLLNFGDELIERLRSR